MVVAVRVLRLAAGAYDVDLRGDLVAGPQPCPRHQGDDVVGVVLDERGGVAHGQLLQGVPDTVVRAGGREVVTDGSTVSSLARDDRIEDRGRPVHGPGIGEGPTDGQHARAVDQSAHQLTGHHLLTVHACGFVAKPSGVIDQHLVHDVGGQGEVRDLGALGHDADEARRDRSRRSAACPRRGAGMGERT